MAYNVSQPATLGQEWRPGTEGATALTSTTAAVAFLIDSSVSETITKLHLPHDWDGPSTGYGKLQVDIYDLADPGAGATLTETRYQPNEDRVVTQLFKTTAGTGGSWSSVSVGGAFSTVNDTDDTDDWLNITTTTDVRFCMNTAGMSSSLQVASVAFELRVYGHFGTSGQMHVDLYNGASFGARLGTLRPPGTGDGTNPTWATYIVGPFTTNPITGLPWTAQQLIDMDNAVDASGRYRLALYGAVGNVSVAYINMVVKTGADKRIASGSTATQTTKPAGRQTNLPVTLTANWAKGTGNYLVVARRLEDPAGSSTTLIPRPMYLAGDPCPHGQGISYAVTLASSGLLDAIGATDPTRTYGFWLERSDGAMSDDSQPYHDLALRPVNTGIGNVRQGISGASAQPYKGVRLLVGYAGAPTAGLTIKLRRSSDNVQLGGDATVTVASVAAGTYVGTVTDPTYGTVDLYSVAVDLATSATLAAATSYYFDLTSSTASTAPWLLVLLDATASHSLTGNETYGGSSDQATHAGSAVAAADFAITISSTINAPATVTAAAASATVNGATVSYVDVDWTTGGALGGTFDSWEVQRSEDGGTTWVDVAAITTEATVTFADYEARKGVAAKYRVRMKRTDGATSDWTTQSNTATPTGTAGVVIFTTNSSTGLTVALPIMGDESSYRFAGADETVFMRLHNRDFQVAFRPLEDRGIVWQFEVLLSPSPGTDGVQAFAALRAIAESDAPYLCMHTGDGERFFGALQVHSGARVNSARRYTAQVTFTQTQADSAAVEL